MEKVQRMMKQILFIAVGLVLSAGPAFAGIANTPHNLSTSQPDPTLKFAYSATNEDEICVFCHTPHGGTLDAPLWNRNMPAAGGYTQYTSAALTKAGIATVRNVNPESLVCLSCHDGSLTVGDIINPSGAAPDNTNAVLNKIVPGFGGNPGPRIGGSRSNTTDTIDLSDDHPISFSYTAVDSANPGTLNPVAGVEALGLTLYGAGKNVECSTCHDPHVDYLANPALKPFLAMSNASSAMCLACHIK